MKTKEVKEPKELKEKKKKSKFEIIDDEFNIKSTRYQTKRKQELTEKNLKKEKLVKEYEDILKNADLYEEDFIKITKKRYKSIQKVKSKKEKNADTIYIPFLLDYKSTVFVAERNCFKQKWVDMFGKEIIEKRINDFKNLLHLKPNTVKYWNPFN